jgi:lipid A 4'-phosphatase
MKPQTPESGPEDTRRGPSWHFALTAFIGLVAAFVFVGAPQIDIVVSRLFLLPDGAFIFNYPGFGQYLRLAFQILFVLAVIVSIAGLVLAAFMRRNLFTLTFPKWLYVVLCLAVGPGLVTNVILKDNWGRARPFHVQEFGGKQTFTPALMLSDQCERNCSFVAGEASAIYMLFFSLAFLARRRRNALLATGIVTGFVAGAVRVAQGGHFLSDVVFAGVLMALIAEALLWLVFGPGGRVLGNGGPVHKRLAALPGRIRAAVSRAWSALGRQTGHKLLSTLSAKTKSIRQDR